MYIETSNAVRLFFPNPSLIQVFFEALANSLDAGATEIKIGVSIQSFSAPETLEVSFTDNGSGFDDESFERFSRLLKPQDSFHKGLGRLVYLKYFDRIEVDSVWERCSRKFVFSSSFTGESDLQQLQSSPSPRTEIRFRKFCGDRVKSYDDLKPSALKQRIIEHFLPTLHEFKRQERDLKIEIELETAESNEQREFLSGVETVTYSDLPELNSVMIDDSTLDVYDKIEMFYHISVGGGKGSQLIAVNIDGRTIPINLIQPSSVPPDCSIIFLFSSSLFAARADSARQRLVLPDGLPEAELFKVLRTYVGNILEENIPQIEERNEETAVKFENDFPHLLGYFEQSTVGLINKDEALCIAQQKFFHEQKRILQCETFVRCFI